MRIVRRIAQMIIFILIGVELGFQYQYEYIPYKEIKDLYVDEGVWRLHKKLRPSRNFSFELQGKKRVCCFGVYGDIQSYRRFSGKKVRVYWDYGFEYKKNVLSALYRGKVVVEVKELNQSGDVIGTLVSAESQLEGLRERGREYWIVIFLVLMLMLVWEWPKKWRL